MLADEKGARPVFRILPALLVAAAPFVLQIADATGPALAAAAVSSAILAVWMTGSAGGERRHATSRRRALRDLATGAGLALSLGSGSLLAGGFGDGPGPFGLPRSLWGLLLGVWLAPLVLTSVGFAAAFTTPDPEDLERLRRGGASRT